MSALFFACILDVLSLTYLVRVIAALRWSGVELAVSITLTVLSCVSFASIFFFLLYAFRPAVPQKLQRYLCVELAVRLTASIGLLLWMRAPWTQTQIAFVESIVFAGGALVSRGFRLMRRKPKHLAQLTREQRSLLVALILVFATLLVGAACFHFTDGFPFEEAWNFVNVSALTVGYGNILVRSVAGKILLLTFGNFMLAAVANFILSMKACLPRRVFVGWRIGYFLLELVVFVLMGATVFAFLERWSFLDALYFAWESISTIGYGDFVPTTPLSWEFWLLYIYAAAFGFATVLAIASEHVHGRIQENIPSHDQPVTGA
jgi:hypothetical protein